MVAKDCFISYSRHGEDLASAVAVEKALTAAGLSCWRDVHEISGGDKFFNEIVDALETAKSVVTIISRQSLERDWVVGEIFTACAFDKIVPVRLGDLEWNETPFGIANTYHCLDAHDHASIAAAVRKQAAKSNPQAFLRRATKPIEGATRHVLQTIANWPPTARERLAWQRALGEAEQLLFAVPVPAVQEALRRYSNPLEIVQALHDLRRALPQTAPSDLWLALAHLARPFDANITLAAIENAKLPETESRKWLGGKSIQQLQEERVTPAPRKVLAPKVNLPRLSQATPKPSKKDSGSKPSSTKAADWIAPLIILGLLPFIVFAVLSSVDQEGHRSPIETAPAPAAVRQEEPSERLPSYCRPDRTCIFPSGHSFARVAVDCYGDEALWPLIWAENRDQFVERNPDHVYSGEQFKLPSAPRCELTSAD